jgi:15-cis-phytoene synthase
LPRDCRPAIQAARLVYSEIGREVERAGFDSVRQRAFVSPQRKLALMIVALGAAAVSVEPRRLAADREPAPLSAIQYLVDASAAPSAEPPSGAGATAKHRQGIRPHSFDERMQWTIGLFEKIEERHLSTNSFAHSGTRVPSVFSG